MKKIYKTNRLTVSLTSILLLVGVLITGYGELKHTGTITSAVAVFLLVIFILANLAFGISTYINDTNELVYVYLFLLKTRIPVKEITLIRYAPTFFIGQTNRSLYITSGGKVIHMSNVWFSENTLVSVTRDLRAINPAITFDESATQLLKD